jgi:NAD(P)H dehydrogenase (quinone)
MFVIIGITDKVGGTVGDTLLNAGLPVRAMVRSADKGPAWKARGYDIALVPDIGDAQCLTRALRTPMGCSL